MTLTPTQARSAFGAFLLVTMVIGVNILYLQDNGGVQATRGTADKVAGRAETERQRRLALAPHEGRAERPPAKRRAAAATIPSTEAPAREAPPARVEGIGRFAPSTARISVMRIPEFDTEAQSVEFIKAVQRGLAERGYEPGAADGVAGIATRAAVMAYEHDHGLALTAEPSEQLLAHMQKGISPQAQARATKLGRMPHAEEVVRSVQHSLAMLGYFAGRIDGYLGEDTAKAIREYEVDGGLVPTGRVSAPLLQRIARTMNASSMRTPG